MKWRVRWLVALGLAGLAAGAFYLLFERGFVRFNYPSTARYPVRGIDVSHHQGAIDWPALAGNPAVQFAYIKATEGGDFKDRRFAENWAAARAAGIPRGAYHFFTFCRDGKTQAENFLATVPEEDGALPMALDLEFGGNCRAEPSGEAMAAEVTAFVTTLQARDAGTPVFYVTGEFYDRYMKDGAHRYPAHHLWLRNIYREPAQQDCDRWAIWQFASQGRVKVVATPVDLNVVCTPALFESLRQSTSRR